VLAVGVHVPPPYSFPLELPFSQSLPLMYKLINNFIFDYFCMIDGLNLNPKSILTITERAIIDSDEVINLQLGGGDGKTDAVLSQAAQFYINATYLIEAVKHWVSIITSVLPSTLERTAGQDPATALDGAVQAYQRTCDRCQDMMMEIIWNKIESLLGGLADFKWEAKTVSSAVTLLQNTLRKQLTTLIMITRNVSCGKRKTCRVNHLVFMFSLFYFS